MLLINISAALSQSSNQSTLHPVIRQSTIHDAIQYNYARKGFTFYFRQVRTSIGGEALKDYHVIDLVNNRDIGSLKNFKDDLGIKPDPNTQELNDSLLMAEFLKKYNGHFEYVMTKITPTKDDRTVEMCRKIMREILKRNAGVTSAAGLGAAYEKNTYFNLQSDTAVTLVDNAGKKLDERIKNLMEERGLFGSGNFSDLGGGHSLASNLGQGAAKFLIERANQEIIAAFFRRLKEAMKNTPELQKLFPQVYKLTSGIETYNFDGALIALKTKLEDDLRNLLANIPTLAELEKYQKHLNNVPELTYFFALCDIMNGLNAGENAGTIIHKVYISPYVQRPTTIQANILKFSGLLSFSLRDAMLCDANSKEVAWISPVDLNYKPAVLLEIFQNYIGFLAQSEPDIVFRFGEKDEIVLKDFLLSNKSTVSNASGFISETYESLVRINEDLSRIKDLSSNEANTDMIDEGKFPLYKNIAVEIINITERTAKFPGFLSSGQRQKILAKTADFKTVYIPAAEKVVLIAAKIEKKDYNEAVFNAGELVKVLLEKIDDKDSAALAGKLFKYGQFFASVATAENGDDVKNAIDAIALPTGGSSIKKDLAFNIAVNGYIGYFRREVRSSDNFVSGFTQSYGITAPIGFTFSGGMRKGGSVSLFAGILDVGAIAQYQLTTDANTGTTTAEPDIEWGNIISPNASIIYGAPFYVPLSLGFGWQWLPNNTSLSDDNYALHSRFNFMIAFDIPIVNMVSVKRQKK